MQKQTGFTIIELVVVIALLGILSAVALPRFVDITEDAHNASVKGTAGALAAAVALVKAKAIVKGASNNDSVTLDGGVSVIVNRYGYPRARNNAECINIWQQLLQNGSPDLEVGNNPPTNDGIEYAARRIGQGRCMYTYYKRTSSDGIRRIFYSQISGAVATANVD